MIRTALAWTLVAAAVGWGTAIAAAPLVDVAPRVAAAGYLVGALVCHQRPERSFHAGGAQLPVCARCAALYWGGALGLAGWMVTRRGRARFRRGGSTFARGASADRSRAAPTRQHLLNRTQFARTTFILGLPIAITLLTSALGVWDPGNAFRAISSAPFGVAVGALLAAVVAGDLR